jgi:outer membrane protein, multidrug efflux system
VPIIAALLAGCAVKPGLHPHDIATPPSYAGLPATQDQSPFSAPVPDEADLSRWWFQFGDVELRKLITRGLQSNLDILAAASRVREARQQEIIAGAAGLPQIDAGGFGAGAHSDAKRLSTTAAGPLRSGVFAAGFDASWEVDVFGGVRHSIEGAQATTAAAVWRMRDGEVALTAEIATNYITLRATQGHIAILRAEQEAQQGLLGAMKARAEAGFVTQLEVNQQSSLVDSTVAQIPELEGNVRALEHALAVLLAQQPAAMIPELEEARAIPSVPSSLPVGLPSDLLRRRPDVRAAERDLGAATASVGVALSEFYPKFDLIGAVALTGSSLGGPNLAELGIGSITWPVFHWGQTQANMQAKEEEEKQAYYAYRKAVLTALQNVEDALSRYTTEQRRLVAIERADATAEASKAIAVQQFRVGAVPYVNVLVAETNELLVRDQLVQAREVFAIDLISLYKALGGGWVTDAAGSDESVVRSDGADNITVSADMRVVGPTLPSRAHQEGSVSGINDGGVLLHQTRSGSEGLSVGRDTKSVSSFPKEHDQSTGGSQLQLGAWRSEAAAMAGWNRAVLRAGDILKGLHPDIVVADLPGKGRFYRLRTKPTGPGDAPSLCQALIAKNLECIMAGE